jgi:hypothetical protein
MLKPQEVMHMAYYGLESVEIVATSFGCLIASLSSLIFVAAIIAAYHGITSGRCSREDVPLPGMGGAHLTF